MPSEYRVVLHAEILDVLFRARWSERRQLIQFFDTLAARPCLEGDYEENDSTGRHNQVKVLGRWAVTYWPDHAVKEVRIVEIETA